MPLDRPPPGMRGVITPGLPLAVALVGTLTLVRLIGLYGSRVDFFDDEAQYWAWSREPAFGYFSKPPLLAWIIAAAEKICGPSEACIRAPAPILYAVTSLLVYAIADRLYGRRVGFYSALALLLAPGAVFSARVISTDVPMLACWALALVAYIELVKGEGGWRWTIVLGVALGLGLLAKYAMIYFLLGMALAAVLEGDARRLLRTRGPVLALVIAAVLVAPNLAWNLQHGLVTFRHTGDNIRGAGPTFNPVHALEFTAAQFGVFGPIVFAVLLAAIWRWRAPSSAQADRLLLGFALPPLALVTASGLFGKVQANWAAPSFIAAIVLATAILVRSGARKWLALSLCIGLAAQITLLVGDRLAPDLHLPLIANGDVYHRTLGWRELGAKTGALARQIGARTIVTDSRYEEASLLYYWRDQPEVILDWASSVVPQHHFELTRPLKDDAALPILFLSGCPRPERLAVYFAKVEPVGPLQAATGPATFRRYSAFKLEGRLRPIGPLGPCG